MVVISCEYYILSAWACLVNFKDESVTQASKRRPMWILIVQKGCDRNGVLVFRK